MHPQLQNLLESHSAVIVRQIKDWSEIWVGWKAPNRYEVFSERRENLASVSEVSQGFFALLQRLLLRSHRRFVVEIRSPSNELLLRIERPFYFFFSDMTVLDSTGTVLGTMHRTFNLLSKNYELKDHTGTMMGRVRSPIWRLWRFEILDSMGQPAGEINKRWGGVLKEFFTAADTYRVSFSLKNDPAEMNTPLKALVLGAAINIDFDFFENNSSSVITSVLDS